MGTYTCDCNAGYEISKKGRDTACQDIDECTVGGHNCSMNGICTNTPGGWRCSCPPDFLGDGFRCVPSDAPYEIYLTSIPEIVIDICNFGLVKFNFSIDETFDRPVSELCIDVISSDAAARTDPSIVHNVVPFYKYEVSLLADLTDLEERPSIHFCPCGQQCLSNNDAPIALIDDECNSQSKGSS